MAAIFALVGDVLLRAAVRIAESGRVSEKLVRPGMRRVVRGRLDREGVRDPGTRVMAARVEDLARDGGLRLLEPDRVMAVGRCQELSTADTPFESGSDSRISDPGAFGPGMAGPRGRVCTVGVRTPVAIESTLPCPASVAFEAALQPATFVYVTLGMLGMPELCGRQEPFRVGETVSGRLFLGNLIPLWAHEIEIVDIDRDLLQLVSHERGGFIRMWHHTVDVEPLGDDRCRLRDTVQIDAGSATHLVGSWARSFYRHRHRRWDRLVRSWGYEAPTLSAIGHRG